MVTLRFILSRIEYIIALLPLLTWMRTWNLIKSIFFFLIKSKKSVSVPPFAILTVTSNCNFNCVMCLRTSNQQTSDIAGRLDYTQPEEMDYDALELFLVENHYRMFFVRIHGGEPFVYSKIVQLLKLLNKLKLPFDIVTNGSFLSEEIIEILVGKYCVNLSISLDAATPEVYSKIRKGGNLETIKTSLVLIDQRKTNLRTKRPVMNASICNFRYNLAEMSKLVHFCKKYSISSLSISEGNYYGNPSIKKSDLIKNNVDETRKEIKKTIQVSKENGIKIRLRFPSLDTKSDDDLLYHKGHQLPKNCLNLYASIWLKPNFDIIGCSSSLYKMGNLKEDDLNYVWNRSANGYPKLRREFAADTTPNNCSKCIYTGSFFS